MLVIEEQTVIGGIYMEGKWDRRTHTVLKTAGTVSNRIRFDYDALRQAKQSSIKKNCILQSREVTLMPELECRLRLCDFK